MKLIIDIDENEYKVRKEMAKDGFDSAVTKMIVNGIPYNPTGDCISRSALLNQIDTTDWSDVRLLVEDAPTVEPRIEYGTDGQPYKLSMTNGKEYERPQGEWIDREAVSNTIFPFWERYECNQCHKFSGYSNFCPNCGADMQKGGAK